MRADLRDWLKGLCVSEAQVVPIYEKIVAESGLAARLVANQTANVLPLSTKVEIKPNRLVEELRRSQSEEYAVWLINQPEPSPEELDEVLNGIRNALPDLRQHFSLAAKGGPRHRRGGRPPELDDPVVRKEIHAKIKARRGPGTKLKDIFKSVAGEYDSLHSLHKGSVSPTTIKRIWLEYEKEPDESP
jgi:hypothetical protein